MPSRYLPRILAECYSDPSLPAIVHWRVLGRPRVLRASFEAWQRIRERDMRGAGVHCHVCQNVSDEGARHAEGGLLEEEFNETSQSLV